MLKATQMNLSLEICEKKEANARLIMNWRNDPHSLAMFYRHNPKVWESFWPEFQEKYFSDPEIPCVFIKSSNEAVGFIRFHRAEHPQKPHLKTCDISINIAPEARGRGYGVAALRLVQDFIFARGFEALLAEVRVENSASKASFEKAGFRFLDQTEKYIPDTGEVCKIFRYISERE